MTRLLLLIVIGATVVSCAHAEDIHATYARTQTDAGSVAVVLNNASAALSVTIDGQLVVDRKHTRRAQVDGIPAGPAHVTVASGGSCEQGSLTEHDVNIMPGSVTTLTLPGPEPNNGCMIANGLYSISEEVGMVAIVLALALL